MKTTKRKRKTKVLPHNSWKAFFNRATSATLVSLVLLSSNISAATAADSNFSHSMRVQQAGPQSSFTLFHTDQWTEVADKDDTSTLLIQAPGLDVSATGAQNTTSATFLIQTERRLSEDEAISRLQSMASARDNSVYFSIDGWPAFERYVVTRADKIGDEQRNSGKIPVLQRITIAVAVGKNIIRFEGKILSPEPTSNPKNGVDPYIEMRNMAANVKFSQSGNAATTQLQLDKLREHARLEKERRQQLQDKQSARTSSKNTNLTQAAAPGKQAPLLEGNESDLGLVINTENGSEIEAVVSPDGQTIIVATNGRNYSVSNDGGQTFTQGSISTGAGNDVAYGANGDPSLAYGQSGDYYFAFIAYPDGAGGAGNAVAGCTTGITRSTDDGQNYSHRGHATFCQLTDPDGGGAGTTCFPDQEHIAADRFNPSASGQDQVYSAWRNFTPNNQNQNCNGFTSGSVQSMLTCSTDGGQTYGITRNLIGDFGRITVGQDGFVYVVTRSFGGDPATLDIDKYSSCQNGLVQEPAFPITVFNGSMSVDCPVPGLDRCNDGNDLRSVSVAVDDLDPSHIFVSFAQHTTTGTNAGATPSDQFVENEDIRITDSTDGGVTWSTAINLNPGFTARRYMPWPCTVGGTAYVGWYDRRAINATENSFTDYYLGSASRVNGSLVAGPESRVSTDSDANCDSGWGNNAPRSSNDSESCTDQPQLAGFCSISGARCDFSDGCPAGGGTCNAGGGGPKYGDYSGIACSAGRVYAAFAAATPPGGPQTTDIDSFLKVDLVCCEPQIQVSGSVQFGEVCGIELQTETLEVCNTGVENLEVDSITSSDPQFAVTAPSSGYPVVISPDFCFPFEVSFDPTDGSASGNLTIVHNDPVNPDLQVPVVGTAGEASIDTFIADSGGFGELCSGDFNDLNLTIQSNGSCDLELDSVSLSGPDGSDFQLPDGSLAGFIIEAGNSLVVPVRFAPANTSDANPRTASVDVASRTPDGDELALDQTPIQGSTGLASVITFIADSGDFSNVCTDTVKDLNLTIQSNGSCALAIDSLSLSGVDQADFLLPNGPIAGSVIEVGNSLVIPIRFAPGNFGDPTPRVASVNLTSHTPGGDALALNQTPIAGTVPPPDLNVGIADSGDFGDVCATEQADLNLTLFNAGLCNLTINAITSDNALFELPSDTQYPLVLSHDADFNFPIRFAPNTCSDDPVTGTLTIDSDSPDEEMLDIGVGGAIPCPNLVIDPVGLSGDFAFPATVMDLDGSLGCYSEKTAVVRNTGDCPLTIESITALGDAADAEFSVQAPSLVSFPLVLPPGEETLGVTVRFTPQFLGDPLAPTEFRGELAIVSDDPDAAGTAELCGEGVSQSGIRVLTTDISSGTPIVVQGVDNITIRSKGKKTPSPINLQFTDVMWQQTTICDNTVTWHVDQETLPNAQTAGSNPKSSYQVSAKEGNLQDSQSFVLNQCDFLEFQLQFQDSDAPACLLLPKGDVCANAGECCSGKCKGPSGNKTCK